MIAKAPEDILALPDSYVRECFVLAIFNSNIKELANSDSPKANYEKSILHWFTLILKF